jgi:hypothetical protein
MISNVRLFLVVAVALKHILFVFRLVLDNPEIVKPQPGLGRLLARIGDGWG